MIAERNGFKRFRQAPVTLAVDQTARVDITMQPGDVKESVNVEAGAPVVETDRSGISRVVENRAMVQLPLISRNFIALASLIPGTTAGGPGNSIVRDRQEGVALSANGQRPEHNNRMLDGADNNGALFGNAAQEFRVQTSSYSAEYGRAAGAVINDRLFWFANYEALRIRSDYIGGFLLPTEAQRRGDLSGGPLVFDSLALDVSGNRLPFAGNQIPQNRINPSAQKLMGFYPQTNVTGEPTPNYQQQINNPNDRDQFMTRLSWTDRADPQASILYNGQTVDNKHKGGVLGYTRIFSPGLLSEIRFNATLYNYEQIPEGLGTDFPSQLGLPSFATSSSLQRFPAVNARSLQGFGGNDAIPLLRKEMNYQWVEQLTWIKGRNTITAGADFRACQSNHYQPQSSAGLYTFNGGFTGQHGGHRSRRWLIVEREERCECPVLT